MTAGNIKGALLALLAMGLYSTHDVIIKVLGATYPALQILFFSALLSFPPLAVLLLRDPTHGTLLPRNPFWVGLRSLCIVISGIGGFYAFSVLPLAQVYSILFAAPLIVTVLSVPLLGEKVGLHRWLAVCAGLCGVLVVLRPGVTPLGLGHLAALMGATATALSAIAVRRLGRSERTVILLLWPMIGNFLLTGASLGFAYRPMELGDLALTGVIAALGLAAGFLLILAYQAGEAANVAPMQYSQMLWAVGYGWFLFGESPDGPTVLGAGLIMASGLYILMRERLGASRLRPATRARLGAEAVTAPRWSLLQRLLRARG
ncbi:MULTISPECIES: DMT family transporter [Paracoccus]|uniref:S-adenosylmethionine uptake transporter n=1 Tax=Paracoccus versutus TaxID=34007 RepID=A0A369TWN9_PARVE|nr:MULTISPECIES: DMT family transporter [Paracoccus]WGR60416.1 DMT family transporter [Paracoccus ferrooxidans]SFX62176.1 S-adenosylmethionine uptake transporter [Paracoccus pantotrophus]MBT0777847.1 DMT family transporter [Paracoccus sp. pheM1]MBT0780506.1 DMT family transporter [Paracoccus sp. pheM1]MCJ1900517.1 DMT family transporter [Paracoccus versutus]